MLAAEAYDRYNEEIKSYGLAIHTPDTIQNVKKEDIPKYVTQFGGQAVIKVPYSNAGQGVFTIVNQEELNAFMQLEMTYDKFIVQSLIGNYTWSSETQKGRFYHVGTIPNAKGETFVADIRLMVSSTADGIKPLCMYSRKALTPLLDNLKDSQNSWEMLGTNLSIKKGENVWDSDTNRLMIMDRRDYNKLGLGLDDLIETYIQTVLSTIAIDKMCTELMNSKGKFSLKKFKQINDDEALISEILI
jgi:putative transposon-encoded protein